MLSGWTAARPGRAISLIAFGSALAVGVIACAPSPPSGPGGGSAQGPAPAPKTLRWAFQGYQEPADGVTSFGTASAAGSSNLEHLLLFHAPLTVTDSENNLVPRLATKVPSLREGDWKTFSDGRMEVTWRLKPGLTWHDGRPLTAEDFVFGARVVNDPDVPLTRAAWWRLISDVQAIDPQTLVISWSEPSILGNANGPDGIPALPRHLVASLYESRDRQAFENSPYWTTDFVGLGPYRLADWRLGSFIDARAFDGYVDGRARIDRIILHYVGDVNSIIAGLLSGDYDVAPYGALLDADQVATLRSAWGTDRGSVVIMEKGVRAIWLQYRDPTAPWVRDARVRQALVHALDRPTLSAALQSSLASPVDIVLPPSDGAYRVLEQQGFPRYPHDLSRARQLLADAGWTLGGDGVARDSSGQPLSIELAATGQGDNVKEMEAVAGQLSAGGFRPVLSPIPPQAATSIRDELKNTMKGALLWPWNFNLSAAQYLTTSQIASERTRWRGNNYGGFTSPGYDALYDQFQTTLDPGDRQRVLAQIARFIAEEIPVVPIYYNIQATTARRGIVGPGKAAPQQAASAWDIHLWDVQ